MSRGFGAMQRTILKTMEAAMRYELHNGALATPYTTLSFLETKHPPGPFPITPGYYWSSSFHAIRLLILRWILAIFGPSTKACRTHKFWHLGVDQQYPGVYRPGMR